MRKLRQITAFILCAVMVLSMLQGFVFAAEAETDDYAALLSEAFIINGNWTESDLTAGNTVSFVFRGTTYTEEYNSARHFATHEAAQNYYLANDPDIINNEV